jgi:hypothetical protein
MKFEIISAYHYRMLDVEICFGRTGTVIFGEMVPGGCVFSLGGNKLYESWFCELSEEELYDTFLKGHWQYREEDKTRILCIQTLFKEWWYKIKENNGAD